MIPPPWVHTIRYNSVFAPAAILRDKVIKDPGYRKKLGLKAELAEQDIQNQRYTWACLMAWTFNFDTDRCQHCGGKMKVLAQIKDPSNILLILTHAGLGPRPPPPPTMSHLVLQLEDDCT